MTEATQHSIMTGIYHYVDRGVVGVAKNQGRLKQLSSTHLPPEIAVVLCATECALHALGILLCVQTWAPSVLGQLCCLEEEGWGCVWVCSRVGGALLIRKEGKT